MGFFIDGSEDLGQLSAWPGDVPPCTFRGTPDMQHTIQDSASSLNLLRAVLLHRFSETPTHREYQPCAAKWRCKLELGGSSFKTESFCAAGP